MAIQIGIALLRKAAIKGVANKVAGGAMSKVAKQAATARALATAEKARALPDHLATRVENHLRNGMTGPANQIINRYTSAMNKVSKNSPFSAGVEVLNATKDYRTVTARGRRAVGFRAAHLAKLDGQSAAEIAKARKAAIKAYSNSARKFVRVQGLAPSQEAEMLAHLSTGHVDKAEATLVKSVRAGIKSSKNYLENPTNDPGFRAVVPPDPRLESKVMQAVLRGASPRTYSREQMADRVELRLSPKNPLSKVKGANVRRLALAAQKANRAVDTLQNATKASDEKISAVLADTMEMVRPGVWVDASGVEWDRDDLEGLGSRLYKIEARGIFVRDVFGAVTKMSRGIFAVIANDDDAFIRGLKTSFSTIGLQSSAPNVYDAVIARARSMSDRERTAAAGKEPYQMFFSSSSLVVRGFIGSLLRIWGLNPNDFDPAELAAI